MKSRGAFHHFYDIFIMNACFVSQSACIFSHYHTPKFACTQGRTHNELFEWHTLVGQCVNSWCVMKASYTEHITHLILFFPSLLYTLEAFKGVRCFPNLAISVEVMILQWGM